MVSINNMKYTFHVSNLIDYLYARTKEIINTLVMVTSQLDAVVSSINVVNPMENQ